VAAPEAEGEGEGEGGSEGGELELKYFEVMEALGGREKGVRFIEYTQGARQGFIRWGEEW
jgi:hypothetical protein